MGTTPCILKMLDIWITKSQVAMKKISKMSYYLLFIDWRKAFDNLPHDIIMRILRELGVS